MPIVFFFVLCQLGRTFVEKIPDVKGQTIRPGDDIPHGIRHTVEFQMADPQIQSYADIHGACAGHQGGGVNEKEKTGRRRMDVYRRLSHSVSHPGLDNFTKRKSTVCEVNTCYERQKDYGAIFFHKLTYSPSVLPNHVDRPSMSAYIAANSVRLQFLSGLAHQVINIDRWSSGTNHWPVTQ